MNSTTLKVSSTDIDNLKQSIGESLQSVHDSIPRLTFIISSYFESFADFDKCSATFDKINEVIATDKPCGAQDKCFTFALDDDKVGALDNLADEKSTTSSSKWSELKATNSSKLDFSKRPDWSKKDADDVDTDLAIKHSKGGDKPMKRKAHKKEESTESTEATAPTKEEPKEGEAAGESKGRILMKLFRMLDVESCTAGDAGCASAIATDDDEDKIVVDGIDQDGACTDCDV